MIVAQPIAPYHLTPTPPPYVEVLVDCPGSEKLFTYAIPEGLEVEPGDILSVPFGSQQVGAIAIRFLATPPREIEVTRIKAVDDIITRGFFPPNYWQLLEQVAEYYYTPLMQVIRVALPPGLLQRSQRRIRLNPEAIPPGAEQFLNPIARRVLDILENGKSDHYSATYLQQKIPGASRGIKDLVQRGYAESYLETPRPAQPKLKQAVILLDVSPVIYTELTKRQKEVLIILQRHGGELWLTDLLQIARTTRPTISNLERRDCLVVEGREVLRREVGASVAADADKDLTPAQSQALQQILQQSDYCEMLLHGVTGSGKTEVYLQAIAPILAQQKSVLILVPEISLTPQLTDRFRARFGDRVFVYHSALSDGERFDTWRQMLTGEPQVVIGTRSAIFCPLPRLGLIVLDEEHDSSFKQDRPAPTYHGRTVAKWRAELENCPLILGSATPSLATWLDCRQTHPQRHYLSLPERVESRPMPPIEIIDLRGELKRGNRSIFSLALQQELRRLQETGKQGILFIHRRGHSSFVSCRSCGYVIECPHCDVSLSYHHTHEGANQLLRCHYCGYTRQHPQNCPECSSPYLKFFGSGTQRVMQELARNFPELNAIRFDSDTTRNKGAHRALLTRFAQGEAQLLVGTQMLTKGLDLPSVSLVGIVAADGLLNLSDYWAGERAFQTLTQVAGRAGRGDDPGRVILQTYTPEHPVVQAVQRYDYAEFVEAELEQREALDYPPYGRLVLLRLSGLDAELVEATAMQMGEMLQLPLDASGGYEVLGPVPAAVLRVSDRYRWQILLKFPSQDRVDLQPQLQRLRDICPPKVRLAVDVDPLHFG
ncbi:MAG: primosomal protein N' [Phormidium sp. BM_Day4_Bin.17]|nr:primosomal protein N' [Phormidium sp. BM_Day4_Bin.17]UCJ11471.1 MAG: primosomal protein N' [Phormidium sp. PBR-2020]